MASVKCHSAVAVAQPFFRFTLRQCEHAFTLTRRALATAETTDFWDLHTASRALEIFERRGVVVDAERLRSSLAEL
jgi:hypothetical protein